MYRGEINSMSAVSRSQAIKSFGGPTFRLLVTLLTQKFRFFLFFFLGGKKISVWINEHILNKTYC